MGFLDRLFGKVTVANNIDNVKLPGNYIAASQDGSLLVDSRTFANSSVFYSAYNRNYINKLAIYRKMEVTGVVASAVTEIVNAMVVEPNVKTEQLIAEPFIVGLTPENKLNEIVSYAAKNLFDYNNLNYKLREIVQRWYVDGKVSCHIVSTEDGVDDIVILDPSAITKLKMVDVDNTSTYLPPTFSNIKDGEVYIYTPKQSMGNAYGFKLPNTYTSIAISGDSIAYVDSGLYKDGECLSYLESATDAFVNLTNALQSAVASRLVRAPVTRVWKIDTGTLPVDKAEAYLDKQISKLRNKETLDLIDNTLSTQKTPQLMFNDLFIARREGSTATEVDELISTPNYSVDDINLLKDVLNNSLRVPVSRLSSTDGTDTYTNTLEVSRDEYTFGRFITTLQTRFSQLLTKLLMVQVVASKQMTRVEFDKIASKIRWEWNSESSFNELITLDSIQKKIDVLNSASSAVGTLISRDWLLQQVYGFDSIELKTYIKKMEAKNSDKDTEDNSEEVADDTAK